MQHTEKSHALVPNHWKFPIDSCDFAAATNGNISELESMKTRLGDAKTMLDKYYTDNRKTETIRAVAVLDVFSAAKRIFIDQGVANVTNAWLKYWEIYGAYNIAHAITQTEKFSAFFNAELPGASLSAFYYYAKQHGHDVDWYGSSYFPIGVSDANVLDDSYGYYKFNRTRWLMGVRRADGLMNDGDATNILNILDWESRLGPKSVVGGVHFYSHDAGMSVGDDYNNQEIINARLHLGCALAGFMTMRPGAMFIAKQYTFFEPLTWQLIAVYATMFDKFTITKPKTSRPVNSEIYLCGVGFRGMPDTIRELLIGRLVNFNESGLIGLLPDCAVEKQLIAASNGIFGAQINALVRNTELFEQYAGKLPELKQVVAEDNNREIAKWLKEYPVKVLTAAEQLPSLATLNSPRRGNRGRGNNRGRGDNRRDQRGRWRRDH